MSFKNCQIKQELMKISKIELELYTKIFKGIVSNNIKNYTHNNELKQILLSITDKELSFSYVIFKNYDFSTNSFYNIKNSHNFDYLFNINKELQPNIKLIILWYLFLLNSLCNKKFILDNGFQKISQMNKIRYLLEETNNIIFKLYLSGKLDEKQVFIFADFYLFWIENYSDFCFINDKNRKIKNMYIFKYLFLLVIETTHEMMKNINKEKMEILLDFMEKLKKSDEINNEYNIIILIKFNFIQSFVEKLLCSINFRKINEINDDYINKIIQFYIHFIKFKFSLSNIFDKFLDNTRIAYEHLYNFEDNLKKIDFDLNIQNYQIKLLKKLIEKEEEIITDEKYPPLNDSFFFNGLNSIISLKMGNLNFDKSFLFFSFNFNPDIVKNNNKIIFPLILFQTQIKKDSKNYNYENIFLLYIEKLNKKENDLEEYTLSIYQSKTKVKMPAKDNEKIFIKKNINYYCCLNFEKNNINLFLYHYSSNLINNFIKNNIKISITSQNNIIFSLGCCDSLIIKTKDQKDKEEKKIYFTGYIGPVIFLKDLILKKENKSNLEILIEKILNLKEGYKDLVFFYKNQNKISNNLYYYNDDFVDYSSINQGKKKTENILISLIKEEIKNLDCSLFLIPSCFAHSHNKNKVNKVSHLSLVSNLCDKHKYYKIKKVNISLSSYNLSLFCFIYDNGFNYFCLLLEYFNQLTQYYLANRNINNQKFNDIFINDHNILIKEIIYIIKLILLIFGNRGNEINLSKAYKQSFMTLFNLLKNLNKIKPIITDIIGDLISLSDIYKCNIFTNYYNLKDVLKSEQQIIKNGNSKEKEKDKVKDNEILNKRKMLNEEKIRILKENYNNLISKNSSFFVGVIEILLSKEFYINNIMNKENYLLMKLTFEKVLSIMDIKDYECLSFISYPNLFVKALSFTNVLQHLMVDYIPDFKILNYKSNNFYTDLGRKATKNDSEEDNNVLTAYFKLLNIFFKNKAIDSNSSKEYFQKAFRFALGNHRNYLPIVYNYLLLFFYFIAENYKFYITYEEISQIFEYLNEVTKLKEEDIYKDIGNIGNENDKNENNENNENPDGKENEENLNINDKIQENKNNKNYLIFMKRKDKIKSIIICIMLEILFSQKEMPNILDDLLSYLKEQKISKNLFLLIRDEIDKYFIMTFNDNEESLKIKENIQNISNYYLNLFNLLTILIYSLLTDNIDYNNYEEEKINEKNNIMNNIETQKMWYVLAIINLLSDISNKIEDNMNKDIYKEETVYCVINFLKFLYNILINNKLNVIYTHNLFFSTVESIFNHCNRLNLNNNNILINLEKGNETMKTINEIIFDIYLEYSIDIYLNNNKANFFKNNKRRNFDALKFQSYFILGNEKTKLKEKSIFNYTDSVSIFFINDYFLLANTNKKYIKNNYFNFKINEKMAQIKDLENILKNQSKFDNIFMIFFLIKIGFYKKEITNNLQNKENEYMESEITILNEINKILIDMEKIIIDDYKKLYILNKEYCSKSNSDYPLYNTIKSIIESKIVNETKKLMDEKSFEDIINDIDLKINDLSKEEFNVIKVGMSSIILEKKNKSISRKGSRKFSLTENKFADQMSVKNKTDQNDLLNYNLLDKEDTNDEIQRRQTIAEYKRKESDNIFNITENYTKCIIPLSNIDNINCFFDQYDEMYLKNPKKELMNTIFAYNFQKSLFNNTIFKRLKAYYLNNFKAEDYTKVLNYPSKMKHYKNGIEPPKFLKYNKSFYVSKVFPITHDYFYDYMLKNNLIGDSIILFKNKLKVPNINIQKESNDFDYNCDLIAIDHSFYGHLINSHENKYLIFQEKIFRLYDKTPKNTDDYFLDVFSICSVIKKPNRNKKAVENQNQRNKINKIVERGINKNIIILYSEIEQIIERRFLLMWQGFEIYLKNGKSYFFNLLDSEICQKILKIFNNIIELSPKLIIKSNFEKHINALQNEWVNDRLDTYEYLLFINKYSSRTFNDSCQYLIFPWILKNYNKLHEINKNELEIFKYLNQIENYSLDEKEKEESQESKENEENKIINESEKMSNSLNNSNSSISEKSKKFEDIGSEYLKYFREFKYPVSAQNERNKKLAIKRYSEDCIFNFKYHSGTHYSTSAYVYFYLMRNEPFSTLLVKLQNYSQENANRMFQSIQNCILTLDSGNDNRELLPEFFSKIEHFINLNCVNFGEKTTKQLVDDAYINEEKISSKYNLISNKINFIIEHRILLDSESIAMLIGDWIDNNFGINQLPDEEDRPLSCNIYPKSTYEQKNDLKLKLNKYRSPEYTKSKLTPEKIIKKISDKINMIVCFGQAPYQIFKEKHPKRIKEEVNMFQEVEENNNIENKNQKYLNEKELDEDYLLGNDDVESLIINYIRPEKTTSETNVKGLFFEINPSIDKVFILSKKREILILESKIYNRKGENSYAFVTEQKIEMPYFKFFEKVNNDYIKNYYILKQKYCFSSFIKGDNKNSPYFNYYNNYVNDLIDLKKKDKDNKRNAMNNYKFITCRYLDNSFKINLIPIKDNQKKKEKIINNNTKIFSFVCQDLVTSCCTISEDTFSLGLKSGKLIKGKVIEYFNNDENPDLDEIEINIKYEKIIQAHKGSINVIEVDHRLGLIITGGDDNYVYIRKLYDLELLTPIKIKDKFIITMVKISPMNFLYVVSLNKKSKHSIIYGYTLSGIQFAKSEYGYYTNIDFTKNGKIVSLLNNMDIAILSGSNLKRIQIKESDPECKEFMDIQKKVDGALWMQYDHFTRKNANTKCRIISYISKDYKFNTININNIKYFD